MRLAGKRSVTISAWNWYYLPCSFLSSLDFNMSSSEQCVNVKFCVLLQCIICSYNNPLQKKKKDLENTIIFVAFCDITSSLRLLDKGKISKQLCIHQYIKSDIYVFSNNRSVTCQFQRQVITQN